MDYTNRHFSFHGGAIYDAARRWRVSPDKIVDFSANINPFGQSSSIIEELRNNLSEVQWYPDCTEFLSVLSDKLDVPAENIVLGNGSTALIFAAVRAVKPKQALLLEPAFGEYSRALHAAGVKVDTYLLKEDRCFLPDFAELLMLLRTTKPGLTILNNPHNPSGALCSQYEVANLAVEAKTQESCLIVDEAFIDYAPAASVLAAAIRLPNLIVIRSLTKFYAIPGLRIGYAICNPDLASRLKNQMEAWPVGSVSLRAARVALSDESYAEAVRFQNERAREQFMTELGKIPRICVFPSAANFLLIKLIGRRASDLATWLEPHRILIRCCDSFRALGKRFIRVAVRLPEENMRLASLIGEWLEQRRISLTKRSASGGR